MKNIITAALLVLAVSAQAGTPYYQHPVLTPSSIQGEIIVGPMRTNAGWSQESVAPIFYHNAAPTDPWYHPSSAPLVIGWSAGGGSVSGGLGSLVDVGPQIIYGFEGIVGAFSANGKASIVSFFNCSSAATACGSFTSGVIANGTFESGGKFSTTWKEVGAHPVGYLLALSASFGGPKP